MLPHITTETLNQSLEILTELPLSVYVLNKDMVVTYWNDQATEVSGFSRDEVLGACCSDNILRHTTEDGVPLCEDGCPARACLEKGEGFEATVYLHHKDGHRVLVDAKIIPVFDDDGQTTGVIHVAGVRTAMDRAMAEVRKLRQLTTTDTLTELPNRKGLGEATASWLSELERNDRHFALCMIDVNDFKQINDTLGHSVGDRVLKMIGNTLRNVCRGHDFIGRWGGDEFMGLVTVKDEAEIEAVSNRIRTFVKESFLMVDNQRVSPSVSVGMAMAVVGDTPESLLDRADEALYEEKRRIHGASS